MTNPLATLRDLQQQRDNLKPPKKIITKKLAPTAAYMQYLTEYRILSTRILTETLRLAKAGLLKLQWDTKSTPN